MAKKKETAAPPAAASPCTVCGGQMTHVRTIPAAGMMPALLTFICSGCGCPRTEEGAPVEVVRKFAA
jgi:hypothetical protein